MTERGKTPRGLGRLGDPRTELFLDPRVNIKLLEALSRCGVDRNRVPPSLPKLSADATIEEYGDIMAEAEAGFENLYETLPNELPGDKLELDVVREIETIEGPEGRDLNLYIFRPALKGGPLPCVVYFHGGAMTILKTTNKVHTRWCISLAAQGMVVVAVDFRNAWTEEGFNPFPAGLNDSCAAVSWIYANKEQLGIRNLVVQGDDGGGNIVLALALTAAREGWSYRIDGVCACSPFISGAHNWSKERKLNELPSLIECRGYFVNSSSRACMAHVYAPELEDATNPLAWPYHATAKDMNDLPPHMLVMDELDPLRDEGIAYCRKLSSAGVSCVGQVNVGLTHAASLIFRQAIPFANQAAVRSVAAFARHS